MSLASVMGHTISPKPPRSSPHSDGGCTTTGAPPATVVRSVQPPGSTTGGWASRMTSNLARGVSPRRGSVGVARSSTEMAPHRRQPDTRRAPDQWPGALRRVSPRRPNKSWISGKSSREIGEDPLVELRGFEPLTPSMPWRCATSCATAPYDYSRGAPVGGDRVSLSGTPRDSPNRNSYRIGPHVPRHDPPGAGVFV
jgi:hypothetical protein